MMKLEKSISKTSSTIGRLRTIATALVGNRLDYLNSFNHNNAVKDVLKHQRMQFFGET